MADADEFSWGKLGENWWVAAGKEVRASPEMVRFACSRHQGASATASARLAGLEGSDVALRQRGYRMVRTTVCCNLLALAAAETGDTSGITAAEIAGKLAKMIRSPDATISIRAIEAHAKREAAQRELRASEVEEPSAEERVDAIIRGCKTIEAVLFLYAELFLTGDPGP